MRFSSIMRNRAWIVLLSLSLAAVACNLGAPDPTPRPITIPSATPTVIAMIVTSTPQPSATSAPTNTNVPAPVCTPRTTWIAYRVQPGDSLSILASRTGTTTATLVNANCLANANQISVGQLLYLPRIPDTPVPTITRLPVVSMADYIGIPMSQGQSVTERTVQPNTQVLLTVEVKNAANVSFYAIESGHGTTHLGTSANPTSMAQLVWQVPNSPGLVLFLHAEAKGTDGVTSASTLPVKVMVAAPNAPDPLVGKLTVSPSEGPSEIDRTVKANMQVTLVVDGVSNAQKVSFYMQDNNGIVTLLGISNSPTTNAQLLWQTPNQAGQNVKIFAVALGTSGTTVQTQSVLIRLAA